MADRSLSLLVRFAALDRLSAPLRQIRGGARETSAAISATRREITALKRSQAGVGAFRDLERQLNGTSGELGKTRARIAELKSAIASTEGPTGKLARSLAAAEREEGRLVLKHEAHGRELQDLSRKLEAAGIDVADLKRHEDRLADSLYSANKRLAEQKDQLERNAAARARVQRAQEIGGRMQSGGATAIAAGAAIGAPLIAAGVSTAAMQTQLTDIGQKAALSRAETEKLGREFDRLGPKVAQLPSNLARGVDTLAGLGASVPDAMAAIDPIGRAATAYNAEITDLAASTYASLSNLKVPARDTARTLDIMASAGKAGAFEMKDMAQYFPQLTGSFNALGQKGVGAVADLSAALQITRRDTGDASTAANNLQNLLNKVNTKETIDKFRKFGVDLQKELKAAAARGQSPIEAIAELTSKALKGDMSKVSFLFGDAQVQAAIRPLVRDLDDYRAIRAEALAAQGSVEADFAERMRDAAPRVEKLKAQAQALGHTIGGALLPPAIELMDRLSAIGERVGAWAQRNPELVAWLAKGAAIIALLLVGLGGMALAVGSILGPFAYLGFVAGKAWPVLKLVWGAARLLIGPLVGLARVVLILGGAMVRAGLMMLANPMILAIVGIVAAIALAGYLIWKHWDTIKAAFDGAIAWLGQAWEWLKAKFLAFPALFGPLGAVAGLVIRHWDAIKGGFQSGWVAVKDFFSTLPGQMKAIGKAIIDGLLLFITPGALTNRLLSIAKSGVAAFKNYFGIKSPSRLFAGFGGNITEGLERGIARGADGPLDRVRRLGKGVAAAWAASAVAPALALSAPAPAEPAAATQDRSGEVVRIEVDPGPAAEPAAPPQLRPPAPPPPVLARTPAPPVASPRPGPITQLKALAPPVVRLSLELAPRIEVVAPVVEQTLVALDAVRRGSAEVDRGRELRLPPIVPASAGDRPIREGASPPLAIENLNIYAAPGQSAEDIAEAVRRELERVAREAAAARRSSYDDEV